MTAYSFIEGKALFMASDKLLRNSCWKTLAISVDLEGCASCLYKREKCNVCFCSIKLFQLQLQLFYIS